MRNVAGRRGSLASWITHTVAVRTTLAKLAGRYRTTPDVIRSVNAIPSGMRLKAGATVLVPRLNNEGDIPMEIANTAITLFEPDLPDTHRVIVVVKRKDSLQSLSKRFGVSARVIVLCNPGIKERLRVGQKLALALPLPMKNIRVAHAGVEKAKGRRNRIALLRHPKIKRPADA
jgi:membrane-bound lytic murein transglycosylase D